MIRKILVLCLLVSFSVSSQVKAINVKINAIITDDSNPKIRKYTINYQIENTTVKPVTFFLSPKILVPKIASEMTLFPVYRVFINDKETLLDGPFFEKDGVDWETKFKDLTDYASPEAEKITQLVYKEIRENNKITVDNYKKNGGLSQDEDWIIENQNLLASKIKLNPKEIKKLVIKTSWNLERYFTQDDIEYYLDERDKYKFELTLDLKKTAFKEKLSAEEYSIIEKDKNFIEGVFKSNKVELNFK